MHGVANVLSLPEQRSSVGGGLSVSAKVLWLIAGLSLVRVLLGSMLGLSYDETYIAVMSHHLGWGYTDHPPAAMALSALAQAMTGSTDNLVMRLPAIILFAGTTWLIFCLGRVLFGERAGWYGALLLSLMPALSLYLGVHGLTDAPMIFCLSATALCLSHALFDDRPRWLHWILAGIFAGLSMAAKYTAGLALLGFAIYFLTSRQHRKLLKTPAPYVTAATALLIVLPILAWNAQHDWISFKFQAGRIGSMGFEPLAFLTYLGAQSLFFQPGPWLLSVLSMVKAVRLGPNNGRTWFLFCAGALPIIFFACLRLSPSPAKGYHWAASGYLLICPLAGWLIEDFIKRWPSMMRGLTQTVIATFVLILGIIVVDTKTNWLWSVLPSLAQHDPLLKDSVDWSDLTLAVKRLEDSGPQPIVGVGLDWEECVKADWALRGRVPILCLTQKPLQYPLLRSQSDFRGRDVIVFSRRPWQAIVGLSANYFSSVEQLETIVLKDFGRPFSELTIARGTNFNGQYPWPYELKK